MVIPASPFTSKELFAKKAVESGEKAQITFFLIRGFQYFSCKHNGYTSNSGDYGYMYCIIVLLTMPTAADDDQ
jgi:hypothetical protein